MILRETQQPTTICAPATALGGAIGIIRVSGTEAISITDKIFQGKHSLKDAKGYTLHYGSIQDESASTVDDVMVSVYRAPHSYTGEDSVEISCHGSAYIIDKIIELLCDKGCKYAAPGEYTQRAFLNGKMDLSQAEAVADLIASQNAAQHRVAISQLRGGISTKLHVLRDQLLHLTSLLELELDFSDHEDLEFADRTELVSLSRKLSEQIATLIASFAQGNAIKNGVLVAIIGAPNVGKSTLLNALLDDDKAIVSDIQGTTRDTIEDTVFLSSRVQDPSGKISDGFKGFQKVSEGALFRFIDTAGIRKTSDKIENLGIERSLKAAAKAQIIILMRDPNNDYPDIKTSDDQTVIKVYNKSKDFQAINGTGLEDLKQQLVDAAPQSGDDGTVITNVRHKEALLLAHEDISRALSAMEDGLSGDLIAEDLRQCIEHLSDIVGGSITTDEVLGNIFAHFCIGK